MSRNNRKYDSGIFKRQNGKMKQYRGSRKDCAVWPLKSQSIGKSAFKTIAVTVGKELFEKMHYRLQTPMANCMKRLRSITVEPVLGESIQKDLLWRVNV